MNPSTSRLKSLLEMFDLGKRTIEKFTDEMLIEELDSEAINNVLLLERNKAHDFFEGIF